MGLEMLMARDQQQRRRRPICRYQRLRGDNGDGGEEVVGVAGSAGMGMARRPLRLRRRMGKAAMGRIRRVPLLFRMARRPGGDGGKKAVRLMRLVFLLAPARRVAALLAEIVRRMAATVDAVAAAECPTIVFSSQWGLPVLSHSASTAGGAAGRSARLRAFYLERSLSAGASSPC